MNKNQDRPSHGTEHQPRAPQQPRQPEQQRHEPIGQRPAGAGAGAEAQGRPSDEQQPGQEPRGSSDRIPPGRPLDQRKLTEQERFSESIHGDPTSKPFRHEPEGRLAEAAPGGQKASPPGAEGGSQQGAGRPL
ncbi:hypothetical protein H696_05686 [Fonticula alba]|uniref:Uncharacterized protein n=1 Tax=Fonticula alba TaxID=691883 RepID=A0A058Z0E9_FONAL|nr:hypothetical protein H696_05686 [Fonticula alba]KCV67749.1 hypothetical protein H696_05686 [Fonticula alba]|eukprot:XP_009497780.1 hypothetical protein H696_05686 [Fonticula alba]